MITGIHISVKHLLSIIVVSLFLTKRQFVPADTDPVVSAHGIEAVGSTDEDQVIVSGYQHFDEVVALVLKRYDVMKHFEKQSDFFF